MGGLARLSKGRSQLRQPYVGARNSSRNQPVVSLDFIGSTSATALMNVIAKQGIRIFGCQSPRTRGDPCQQNHCFAL
jgi:hypothetical protein